MTSPARIFISHSSADSVLAIAIAAGLEQRPGLQVLLDRSGLEPGKPWRRELHEWMARCNAGVVVLTQEVLDRPAWVLKEAIILGWRLDLERDFRLMFALGPGLKRQAFIDKGFALAQLGEPQELATPAATAQVDALVAEVAGLLPLQAPPSPYDELAQSLSALLQIADSKGATYPAIAKHLGLATPAIYGPDKLAQLADELARAIVRGRDDRLAICELVKMLTSWNKEPRIKLVEMLRPYWVDAQAAAMLLRRAKLSAEVGGPGAVVIAGNAVPEFTAETYVRRAYNIALDAFQMAGAVSLEGGDPYTEIRRELCQYARAESWVLRSTKLDDLVVQKLRGMPFLIVVPLSALPDPLTVERLRNDFPRAVFIAPRPVGGPEMTLDIFELLPPLSREREGHEFNGYRLALNAIRNL